MLNLSVIISVLSLPALAGVSSGGGGLPNRGGPGLTEPVSFSVASVKVGQLPAGRGPRTLFVENGRFVDERDPNACSLTLNLGETPEAGSTLNVTGLVIASDGGGMFPCDPVPNGPHCPPPPMPVPTNRRLEVSLDDDIFSQISCPFDSTQQPDRAWLEQQLSPAVSLSDDIRKVTSGVVAVKGIKAPMQVLSYRGFTLALSALETNPRTAEVKVINDSSAKVVATWKLPAQAMQLSVEGDKLFALDADNARLYSASLAGMASSPKWTSIALPKGDAKQSQERVLLVHGNRAFVSLDWQNRIDVIDLDRGTVVHTITDLECVPALLSASNDTLVAGSIGSGNSCSFGIAAFDLRTFAKLYRVPFAGVPRSLAVHGFDLLVSSAAGLGLGETGISVLELKTGAKKTNLPILADSAGMLVDGNRLLVPAVSGELRAYDLASGSLCGKVFLLASKHLTWPAIPSVAVDAAGRVVAANLNDGSVNLMDTSQLCGRE